MLDQQQQPREGELAVFLKTVNINIRKNGNHTLKTLALCVDVMTDDSNVKYKLALH